MALSFLDSIWLRCAAELELPVARGGEAYVHFDGRVLHIADATALDEDDSLAQLLFHEICHLLVQGPARRHTPDWGLDNQGGLDEAADALRERAALRLQAHLAGAFSLRAHLFPTTVVRPFFEALPDDALFVDGEDDGSSALARAAATRAGHAPFRAALSLALGATARALFIECHRGGAALDARRRCGDCAWRAPSGHCRAADRRLFVRSDELGCARHESTLDCLRCGACCRSGYDAVPARARDRIVKRHPQLLVARTGGLDVARRLVDGEDRCAALVGAGPYACSIYADRPRTCSELPQGGAACLTARRRVGLSLA